MPPSSPSVVAFVSILVAVVASGIVAAVATADPARRGPDGARAAAAIVVWMSVTGAIIASGVLEGPGDFPRPLPFLLGQAVVVVAVAASAVGARLARLPLTALLGFQAFRLPLEAVLHAWYTQGVIPVQMTWSGENLDVVTGLLGVVAAAAGRLGPMPRAVALALNTVGFVLLLNVMRVAVRSIPGPLRAYDGEALRLPFSLPYGWIVPVCVMGALFGHLVTFRALRAGGPR